MGGSIGVPTGTPDPEHRSRGQSVVEFALLLPVMLVLILGIMDLARVFTSLVTLESAAREAADFGAFNRSNWSPANLDKTLDAMEQRWCVASSHLEDYQADGAGCSNPRLPAGISRSDVLIDPVDGDASDCWESDRARSCLVQVDLEYEFDLLLPVGLDIMGTRLGLDDTVTFTRSSTFAVGDFELDEG